MTSAEESVIIVASKGLLLGASALGMGALCYYGLGLSSQPGAANKTCMWPKYVKERIRTTYMYFGGALGITTVSAGLCFHHSPGLLAMAMNNSKMSVLSSVAVSMGMLVVVHKTPYQKGFGTKQAAWALHSAYLGVILAPMCFLGGPMLLQASIYTVGIIGGLSAIAVCAPSGKFLKFGGPLAIGLGAVFTTSLASLVFPPTTPILVETNEAIAMYGGLVVFSGLVLYDTQRIIHKAETHPIDIVNPYDPVKASISIYLDTLNIFMRIAYILVKEKLKSDKRKSKKSSEFK